MNVHCFLCEAQLPSMYFPQPSGGTTFRAGGNYGSTVWDMPVSGWLEIVICDDCLKARAAYVLHGQKPQVQRTYPVYEPWDPEADRE